MIRPHAHPVPAEVRTRNVPAEIEPATQNEASLLGRIQTARMLASTIDDKSRRVIGNHLGMTASQRIASPIELMCTPTSRAG